MTHKKININDMFQLIRSFKTVNPNWCIIYKGSSETINHLFLSCPITLGFWPWVFDQGWIGFDFFTDNDGLGSTKQYSRYNDDFLQVFLGILIETKLSRELRVSLCCGLYEEKGTLSFLRILGGHWNWYMIGFLYFFLGLLYRHF